MKKFNYYYWFAYPCLSEPVIEQIGAAKPIGAQFAPERIGRFNEQYFACRSSEDQQFFIVENDADDLKLYKLSDKIDAANKEANFADANVENLYFCYSDPCPTPEVAGWTARLYLTMIIHLW